MRNKNLPSRASAALLLSASIIFVSSFSGSVAGKPPKDKPGGGGEDPPANIAFVYSDARDGGLFLTTSDGSGAERLTRPGRNAWDQYAVWSPDLDANPSNGYLGEIAFLRNEGNGPQLYVVRPDGTGLTLLQNFNGISRRPFGGITWSPDGRYIVYNNEDIGFVDAITGAVEFVQVPMDLNSGPVSFSIDLEPETNGYQGSIAITAGGPTTNGTDIVLIPIEIATDGTRTIGTPTVLNLPDDQSAARWSPTQPCLAFVNYQSNNPAPPLIELGVLDIVFDESGAPTVVDGEFLTDLSVDPDTITWSPDGTQVAWDDIREGTAGGVTFDILRIRADGSDKGVSSLVTTTNSSRDREVLPDWNPNWVNDLDLP